VTYRKNESFSVIVATGEPAFFTPTRVTTVDTAIDAHIDPPIRVPLDTRSYLPETP
jgi:hypothetical protein